MISQHLIVLSTTLQIARICRSETIHNAEVTADMCPIDQSVNKINALINIIIKMYIIQFCL
jgi:hypothetical protein